jgi:hypothetical protein
MVPQCMEDKRTTVLSCICKRIHEGTDLSWYMPVRVCVQWISVTKTQGNLGCPGFSKLRTDEVTKALIFRLGDLASIQKRGLLSSHTWFMGYMKCSFPPVTSRHSHWEHAWRVREIVLILLHKMCEFWQNG